ncbi:MAG: DUF3089 domain-containing protein [Solirubrobacterales bacterium]|nr:DUF3089 domain-containing protein [Solirubrobacterales bacterium]
MRCIRVALLASVAAAVLAVPAASPAAVKWLCKPGLKTDQCSPGLGTTRFSPAGTKLGTQTPRRGARKVDCFYVYPTVSDQKTMIATKALDPEIKSIALYQAARYTQECRVFAPVYRQRTIAGIQDSVSGGGPRKGVVNDKGYDDVLEAWRSYLKHDNKGRGVVLVGHSQGTFVLRQLIAGEIDKKPSVRRKLVSALLLGGNVLVKKGKDAGGDFQHIPACRSSRQLGCVVAFSTFDETPPADALFGRTATAGREVLCTNPARLQGGSGPVTPIFPSEPFAPGTLIGLGIDLLGVKQPTAATPWVTIPGAYTTRCASEGGARYLKLTAIDGAPDFKPSPTAVWGLHLVDANIALGNLVDLVADQAAAYVRRRG